MRELFRQWSRCRDGTITRRGLKRLLAPVRRQVESLLLRGYGTGADGMCRELLEHRDRLYLGEHRDCGHRGRRLQQPAAVLPRRWGSDRSQTVHG
ncbi:MAG: hypothetical protein KDA79_05825 [Planctomycetaceae bacterium]|nr:hypothetical protein [Planctomycetaceae bacterium]